jgi:predicted RNase H-like HicB family nuclease
VAALSTTIVPGGDPWPDLVASFPVAGSGVALADTEACVSGLVAGEHFLACDGVLVRASLRGRSREGDLMRKFTAVVEKCADTGVYVGYVPGFPGAHSQGLTLDELSSNLREVIEMLLEDGEPELQAEFVGTQQIVV